MQPKLVFDKTTIDFTNLKIVSPVLIPLFLSSQICITPLQNTIEDSNLLL